MTQAIKIDACVSVYDVTVDATSTRLRGRQRCVRYDVIVDVSVVWWYIRLRKTS